MAKKANTPSPVDELEFSATDTPQDESASEDTSRHGAKTRRVSLWRRLSVGKKLIVLVLFPVIGLIYFATAGSSVSTSLGNLDQDRQSEMEMTYLVSAKNLMNELQTERGTSGVFLANASAMSKSQIDEARTAFDANLQAYHKVVADHPVDSLRPEFGQVVLAANKALETLPEIREKVDGKRLVADDAVLQYSKITQSLLQLIGRANELTPDAKMYTDSRALIALLRAVESMGRQRYMVAAGLQFQKLPPSMVSALDGEVRDEETFIKSFMEYAAPAQVEAMNAALDDRAVKSANTYRTMVLDSNVQASFGGLTVPTWFSASSGKIGKLYAVSTDIEKSIFESVQANVQQAYTQLTLSAVFVLVGLFAALIPAFIIARGITRPLRESAEALRAVADGDFSRRVDVNSTDEVGQVSQSVNDMAAQLQVSQQEMARSRNIVENAPISIMMADTNLVLNYMNPEARETFAKLEAHLKNKVATWIGKPVDMYHGSAEQQRQILSDPENLPYRAQVQIGPEWLDLLAAAVVDQDGHYLGPMLSWTVVTEQKRAKDRDLQVQAQVTGIASELNDNSMNLVTMSNTMAANAEETSSQGNTVSAAAEQVSANVSSVAAAVEEMSATIQEVSKTVLKSSEVTREAVEMSRKASGLVTQLGESSNEISQVTKVISSIAQQTNILALNATIEAARAGEAGKGFAVVANEVKELAKNTSKMTEDISTRIAGIQASTGEAVISIEEINRIMSEVDSLSSTVSSAVEEQSATTNEISRSMTEASTGVNDIVRNITAMAEAAKDTSKQALTSKESAENLGQLSARLREIVDLFAQSNAGANGGNGKAKSLAPAAADVGHAHGQSAHLS